MGAKNGSHGAAEGLASDGGSRSRRRRHPKPPVPVPSARKKALKEREKAVRKCPPGNTPRRAGRKMHIEYSKQNNERKRTRKKNVNRRVQVSIRLSTVARLSNVAIKESQDYKRAEGPSSERRAPSAAAAHSKFQSSNVLNHT